MEHSGNISIFNIPGALLWGYPPEFQGELFLNIPGIYHGNVPRIFHEHIFARWDFPVGASKNKTCKTKNGGQCKRK